MPDIKLFSYGVYETRGIIMLRRYIISRENCIFRDIIIRKYCILEIHPTRAYDLHLKNKRCPFSDNFFRIRKSNKSNNASRFERPEPFQSCLYLFN